MKDPRDFETFKRQTMKLQSINLQKDLSVTSRPFTIHVRIIQKRQISGIHLLIIKKFKPPLWHCIKLITFLDFFRHFSEAFFPRSASCRTNQKAPSEECLTIINRAAWHVYTFANKLEKTPDFDLSRRSDSPWGRQKRNRTREIQAWNPRTRIFGMWVSQERCANV